VATTLVLPLIVIVIGLSWWLAVHYAPAVLSRVLPRDLTFLFGACFFIVGAFGITHAVYEARDPSLFLTSLVQCFGATWFMLAPSAALRGDPDDAPMMKNLAVMLGAALAVLVLSLYVDQREAEAGLQLWLILFGAAVALRPRLWSR
jgi:hypothetical protein